MTIPLEFQRHLSARLPLQQVTDLLGVLFLAVHAVHLQDGVASDDARFLCRPTFVGVGDAGELAVVLDDGADAAVFACGHELGVLDVRLGDEDRVGVEAFEHGLDGSLVEFARVDFVDIVEVQLTEETVVDVEAFGDFEVVLLLLGEETQRKKQCD